MTEDIGTVTKCKFLHPEEKNVSAFLLPTLQH